MALGVIAGGATPLIISAPASAQTNFSDVSFGYWARPFIQRLAQENIIAGFPDGTFKPEQPVTRAQFAALVRQAFSKPQIRSARSFPDVPANYWASQPITEAYRTGFLTGYPDGTFKPNQQIPKVQVLVSVVNGLGLRPTGSIPNTLNVFRDENQIPTYAQDEVAAATQKSIVVSYPDKVFLSPQEVATRADVAAYIYQALVDQGKLPKLAATDDASKYIVGYKPPTTTGNTNTNTNPPVNATNGLKVASGTTIDVKYPGVTDPKFRIIMAPGQTVATTLEVVTDVKTADGTTVLIPKGSRITGKLEPVNITGSTVTATRFDAETLIIGNNTYNISAASNPVAATQDVSPQTIERSQTTATAQAILSTILGGANIEDLIGGTLGGTGTSTSQNSVILVDPNQLDLKVNSDFFVRKT